MTTHAIRTHEICMGHRVVGHEGKCRYLHGHNYKFEFFVTAEKLDTVGRVLDFGDIKERLCMFVEREWDHRLMLWDKDPLTRHLKKLTAPEGLVIVPFNPTAENMAEYLIHSGHKLLPKGITFSGIKIWETTKCAVSVIA